MFLKKYWFLTLFTANINLVFMFPIKSKFLAHLLFKINLCRPFWLNMYRICTYYVQNKFEWTWSDSYAHVGCCCFDCFPFVDYFLCSEGSIFQIIIHLRYTQEIEMLDFNMKYKRKTFWKIGLKKETMFNLVIHKGFRPL